MEQTDIRLIGEYEDENNIPTEERHTEYLEDFSTYLLKKDTEINQVQKLLEELKESEKSILQEVDQNNNVVYYVEMVLQYNQTDTSYYTFKNSQIEENMLLEFYALNTKQKTLGVKFGDGKRIALIQQREHQEQPTYILTPDMDLQWHKLALRLFQNLLTIYVRDVRVQAERAIDESKNKFNGKQPRPNYKREIRKKMATSTKIFRDCRMEGYDFRETNLRGAMFINCVLSRANFSCCDMEDTFFLNCELTDVIFYKANLNNVKLYHADKIAPVTDSYAWLYEGGYNDNGKR